VFCTVGWQQKQRQVKPMRWPATALAEIQHAWTELFDSLKSGYFAFVTRHVVNLSEY
jgi:hypothetical protein